MRSIRVITIAREHGSGGHDIAERLALALGWELVDERIIGEVARAAHVSEDQVGPLDEKVESWMTKLAKSYWAAAPEGFARPAGADLLDADRIAALTRQVIDQAAARGSCVIVGRGAPCALSGRTDVLRVFVYAPIEERRARLAARLPAGTDPEAEMARVDRDRNAYVKRHYGRSRDDRGCYDLMIDSSLGVDRAAAVILAAVAPREAGR